MARLDRLVSAKGVAQLAAVIGREFPYELLQAVSPLDAVTLQRELGRLVEAELVYQRGLPPQAFYMFKHALVQDAAYQSLLRRTRRDSHQRIAEVLVRQFPETAETRPELLAHHYTEAGQHEHAIPYWQRAGQRAVERSANMEAVGHLTRGLALIHTLPDMPERAEQELLLLNTMAAPVMATKGYAAPETGNIYNRARQLCEVSGARRHLFPALAGIAQYELCTGALRTADRLAEDFLRLAQQQDDSGLCSKPIGWWGLWLYTWDSFPGLVAISSRCSPCLIRSSIKPWPYSMVRIIACRVVCCCRGPCST